MVLYAAAFTLSAMLLALDQWTKFWVESNMELEEVLPLWPPVLELHAVHNYGAAWSAFAGARWVLVLVTTILILVVVLALSLRLIRHPLGVIAAFLILGGGIGNLMDRLFLGYVVDMLRFPFWRSYPTFNVADVGVVTGCGLWILYILLVREDLSAGAPDEPRVPGRGVARRRPMDDADPDAGPVRDAAPPEAVPPESGSAPTGNIDDPRSNSGLYRRY